MPPVLPKAYRFTDKYDNTTQVMYLQHSSSMRESADIVGLTIKYRPKNFSELIGQVQIKKVLESSIKNGRVPQQILFSGGSGLGKTTIARVYASMILCHTPIAERAEMAPCDKCVSCQEIFSITSSHPDLVEFDAASNGGKDEIREIAQRAILSPVIGSKKIYIIDEAHGLSNPGGQAFLKLLEEPPKHVIFMLCTTDPEKMLKTNRGRCIEFRLKNPTNQELLNNLRAIADGEKITLTDEVLKLVIEASDIDLGVRGTVATLGKIINSSLTDSTTKAEAEVILGLPPKEEVSKFMKQIKAREKASVYKQLELLVESYGVALVKKVLIDVIKEEIFREGIKENDYLLLWYKTLLESENTRLGLEYFATLCMIANNIKDFDSSKVTEGKASSSKVKDQSTPLERIKREITISPALVELLNKCEVDLAEGKLKVKAPLDIAPLIAKYYQELKDIAIKLGVEAEFLKG